MSKIQDIIYKYLRNTATISEIETLEEWVRNSPENASLFKDYVYNYEQHNIVDKQFNNKEALEKFRQLTNSNKKLNLHLKWVGIAATIILILGLGMLNKIHENTSSSLSNTEKALDKTNILLTLDDGSQKILKEGNSSTILGVSGDTLQQDESNQIIYNFKTAKKAETRYHKLEIPLGKTFKIKLSDGSQVWLNAGSSLRFPVQFHDQMEHREVELTGEAFFEVVKNEKLPFIVKTSGVVIKVLGTRFNVSSYNDDESIKTTLVEGSVNITEKNNKSNNIIIVPKEQTIFNKSTRKMVTEEVNIEKYIAWVDNRLFFENDPFHEIIKKIERSYNVEVINNHEALNAIRFTGEFDIEDVSEVLATFTANTPFNYKIKNNKITISK
jgi:transmembrane sensor